MSDQVQFPVGAQVWAKMPGSLDNAQPTTRSDTEVLGSVVGHERIGNRPYYHCRAPEAGGIWTFASDEVVSGIRSVRHPLTLGAQFQLGQVLRIKRRVEWKRARGGDVQKSGRVVAGWCKQVQGANNHLLEYSYWIDFSDSDQSQPRNWYPQEDLES